MSHSYQSTLPTLFPVVSLAVRLSVRRVLLFCATCRLVSGAFQCLSAPCPSIYYRPVHARCAGASARSTERGVGLRCLLSVSGCRRRGRKDSDYTSILLPAVPLCPPVDSDCYTSSDKYNRNKNLCSMIQQLRPAALWHHIFVSDVTNSRPISSHVCGIIY